MGGRHRVAANAASRKRGAAHAGGRCFFAPPPNSSAAHQPDAPNRVDRAIRVQSMSKREKYHQLYDGDWVLISRRGHRHMCCDCALVHIIDMRDVKDGTEVRFRRDNRATAAARRAFKFARDEE